MGLILSLFYVASFQDMSFCQPQYVQHTLYGFTFVLICVQVLFANQCKVSICDSAISGWKLSTCIFCINGIQVSCAVLHAKHSHKNTI